MTLSETMAEYVIGRNWDNIPAAVKDKAKRNFLDLFGCMIAGSIEANSQKMNEYIERFGGRPESSVFSAGFRKADMRTAALINTMSAHMCDFDDMSTTLNGHPSAVIAPATFAVAEAMKSTGQEALEAYVTGVEVASALGRGINGPAYDTGWNATTTIALYGAAAAASKLMKLDFQQTVNAFGIAAGESSGTKGNYGTDAKDITVGRAAEKGVFSAFIAKCGYQANPEIFECTNGVCQVFNHTIRLDEIKSTLENGISDFTEPGLTIKPYPSCRSNHTAVDGIVEICKTNNLSMGDIERVECLMQPTAFKLEKYHIPNNGTEAKFSSAYCMGRILEKGTLTIDDFTGDVHLSEELLDFIKKVHVQCDDSFVDAFYGTEIKVFCRDGRTYSYRGNYASGDPRKPLADAEIKKKFFSNIGRVFKKTNCERLYDCFMSVENAESMEDIYQLLTKEEDK